MEEDRLCCTDQLCDWGQVPLPSVSSSALIHTIGRLDYKVLKGPLLFCF